VRGDLQLALHDQEEDSLELPDGFDVPSPKEEQEEPVVEPELVDEIAHQKWMEDARREAEEMLDMLGM
jgi:hypothetical protein